MTTITRRAPMRPLPSLRPRRGVLAALRRAVRGMLLPAAGRRLDPAALPGHLHRDLGLDRLLPPHHAG